METTRRTRDALGALTLVLAATLIVAGHALSVNIGDSASKYVDDLSANRSLHVAGGLLTATAALLLIPGLAAAQRLFAGGGERLALAATTIAGIGAAGIGLGLAMVVLVIGTLAGTDPDLAVRVYHTMDGSALGSLPFMFGYLFPIGVLMLGVASLRASRELRWMGVLLIVGIVLDFGTPSGGLLTAALHVPLALGFALLGFNLWRQREASPVSAPRRRAVGAEADPVPAS